MSLSNIFTMWLQHIPTKKIETRKEENNKLKHGMSEKEILINSLTEKSNKKGPNKCGKQKPDKSENMNLDKLYH